MATWMRDCRHFKGDRPCLPHKEHGVECAPECAHYDPVPARVLIVKLAAPGDVLRTTCCLAALESRWGTRPHVTWVTMPEAATVLEGHPAIDDVLVVREGGVLPALAASMRFDLVFNPDADRLSCALAASADAAERRGMTSGADGWAEPLDEAAEQWFGMGLDDTLKRANETTYAEHLHAMLGVDMGERLPRLVLGAEERAAAEEIGRALGLVRDSGPLIGINTGAGSRWQHKQWTEDGICELSERLLDRGMTVALLGGAEEVERNARLAERLEGRAVHAGCEHPIRRFAGLLGLCDVVVTGDTLALHLALAMGRSVVALFGPTSMSEIEIPAPGSKVASEEMDCLGCYLARCDLDPHCMNTLPASRVEEAVLQCIAD